MYIPSYFREERPQILAQAIREIKLATLVTVGPDGLHISHVPMVLRAAEDGEWALESHVSRGNPHWMLGGSNAETVAIFQGPQTYITPSWYATKQETGKVVPTWNYIAVHAHGLLEAIEDEAWLIEHVGDLTDENESERDHPWSIEDAPPEYIRAMTKAIVGLRLRVTRLEASWKMSQQKTERDRLGAIIGLESEQSGSDVAEVMRSLEADRAIP